MVRKACLSAFFAGFSILLLAQTLEEKPSLIPANPFSKGKLVWGDYDRDGDLDLLFAGEYSVFSAGIKLFRNDGAVFTEVITSLPQLLRGKVRWTDYDLDGYLDIIISGYADFFSTDAITRVFHNDQNGTFSDQTPPDILAITLSTDIQTTDIDNDGDEDLYIPGDYNKDENTSTFFLNDAGVFTKSTVQLIAYENSSSWADFDGDGLVDATISGGDASNNYKLLIYKNKGDRIFEEVAPFVPGISNGKVEWIDFDSDGDLDICLLGTNVASPLFKIIKNNDGSFVDFASGIPNLSAGDFEWGDLNSDGYPDLLISGKNSNNSPITRLYINNAGASFSVFNFTFPQLFESNVELIDFDRDGDSDILLTGKDANTNLVIKVYINKLVEDGGEQNDDPSVPSGLSVLPGDDIKLQWSPASDDLTPAAAITYNVQIKNGTQLITHSNVLSDGTLLQPTTGNAFNNTFYIIKNLPTGNYSWTVQAIDQDHNGSSFASTVSFSIPNGPYDLTYQQPYFSTVQLSWQDTLQSETGFQVFRRTSNEPFSLIASLPSNSTIYTDINLSSGEYHYYVKALYNTYSSPPSNELTVQIAEYEQQALTSFDEFAGPGIVWADIDNDNDLDALAAGNTGSPGSVVVYENVGNFNFSKGQVFGTDVSDRNMIARDFDNDDDIDLMVVEGVNELNVSFYSNNNGVFEYTSQIPLNIRYINTVKEADFNNDGNLDLVIGMADVSNTPSYSLYFGSGNFDFEDSDIDISNNGAYGGNVVPGDYDNDSFVDILLTGFNDASRKLLKNIGGTKFSAVDTDLPSMNDWVAWFDYDADGDLDLLVSEASVLFYQNTGGVFTRVYSLGFSPNTGITGIKYQFSDFDNDGHTDILFSSAYTFIYKSNGDGTFRKEKYDFPYYDGFLNNHNAYYLGDWDDDGDIDIMFCGVENFTEGRNFVYVNQTISGGTGDVNERPSVPGNLLATVGKQIMLNWNEAADDKSSPAEISYNIKMELNGALLRSSESNDTGLSRKINKIGNNGFSNFLQFSPTAGGNYRYSVQAMDASNTPSGFSAWSTFHVPYGPYDLTADHTLFNTVDLQWQDSLSNETSFILERRKLNEEYQEIATVAANTTEYQDLLPDYNYHYFYRIRAMRNNVPSAYSNEVSIDTNRPLPPVLADTTLYVCAGPNFVLTATGTNVKWYDTDQLINPVNDNAVYNLTLNTPATYYLTQEVGGVTSYVNEVHVGLLQQPAPPANIDGTYCEEETIPAITISDGFNIKWYSDAQTTQLVTNGRTFQPVNNGIDKTYYVTQSSGSCESEPGEVVIDIVQIDSEVTHIGESLVVSQENADSYYWYRDGSLVSITYGINTLQLLETGLYTVSINIGDCNELSAPLQVDYITGLDDEQVEMDIFPNPVREDVTISSLLLPGQDVRVTISNTSGQILADRYFKANAFEEIKVSGLTLPGGVYILNVDVSGKVFRKRLVVLNH